MKKGKRVLSIILVGVFLIVCISLVNAGLKEWLGFGDDSDLEGELGESAVAKLRILDLSPPIIVYVSNVTGDGPDTGVLNLVKLNPDSPAGGNTSIMFWFLAQQGGNQPGELSTGANSKVNFTRIGELSRANLSCTTLGEVDCGSLCTGTAMNFSCEVVMRYYDGNGTWGINASVQATTTPWVSNDTKTFKIAATFAAETLTTYLNWTTPPLTTATVNKISDNNITVKNNGNVIYNLIKVNGTDLIGADTPSQYIPTNRFAANNATGNIAATLVKDEYVSVSAFNALRAVDNTGKNTDLTFWVSNLTDTPTALSSQVYNSSRAWILNLPTTP